ncbi:MAG: uroporphyrinogen-III synthase [Desulfurococcales archaeon]|nr:uroporphyrinogen-III synthase [Desulfurococcales archaeon]
MVDEAQERPRLLFLGPDPPPSTLGGCRTIWIPVVKAYNVEGSSVKTIEELSEKRYETIVFTSPRAPRMLAFDAVKHGVKPILREKLEGVDVWAIGPGTRKSVREHLGIEAYESSIHTGIGLAGELVSRGYKSVLGLRSPNALPDLAYRLAGNGVYYNEIHVYEVRINKRSLDELAELLYRIRGGRLFVPVLTSPSIARVFLDIAGSLGLKDAMPLISLGPTTARALEERGQKSSCIPPTYSLEGLRECLETFCNHHSSLSNYT